MVLELGFVKDKVEKEFTFEFSSRCTKEIMYLFLDKIQNREFTNIHGKFISESAHGIVR